MKHLLASAGFAAMLLLCAVFVNAQEFHFTKKGERIYSKTQQEYVFVAKSFVDLTVNIDTSKMIISFNSISGLKIYQIGSGQELGIDTYYCLDKTGETKIQVQTWVEKNKRVLTIYDYRGLVMYE